MKSDVRNKPPPLPGRQPPAPPRKDAAAAEVSRDRLHDLLRSMGRALSNVSLYGAEHRLTVQARTEAFGLLAELLAGKDRINFSTAEDALLVDGEPAEMRNPFIAILLDRMSRLQVAGFTLLKGMSREEFDKLMEALGAAAVEEDKEGLPPELEHLEAERIKYERISESQAVVDKEEAEKSETAGNVAAYVEQILAFLKGEPGASLEGAARAMHEIGPDPQQLAELILEAAAVRQRSPELGSGESLADIVVGALRRTFDGLLRQPSARTQKGRRNIRKTLLLLEKVVLDKLRAVEGGLSEEDEKKISDAVAELVGELDIDTLATEYIKKRHALEKAEDRIMRYIRHRDPEEIISDPLGEKLAAGGLAPDGWRELVVKSQMAGGDGESGGLKIPGGIGALAALLEELDQLMNAPRPDPNSLRQRLDQIDEALDTQGILTAGKIKELNKTIAEDGQLLLGVEEAERQQLHLSRARMLALLAEIVQELAQSLSAINCAIGMILAGHLGDINSDQREVLEVANRCGERLDSLLDRLIEIAGLPEGLEPEKDKLYSSLRPPPPGG